MKEFIKVYKVRIITAIIALIGVGAWVFATGAGDTPATTQGLRGGSDEIDEGKTAEVSFTITAQDWTDRSTPTIIHMTGCCAQTEGVEIYHAVTASEVAAGEAVIEDVAEGKYEVEYISPVNEDGSIYRTGEPQSVVVFARETLEEYADDYYAEDEAGREGIENVMADDGTATIVAPDGTIISEGEADGETILWTHGPIAVEFEKVEAEDVKPEELAAIEAAIEVAIEKGDDTLSGDAGKAISDKLAENVAANPNYKPTEKPAAANGNGTPSSTDGKQGDDASAQSSQTPSQPSQSGNRVWVEEQGHYEDIYETQWVSDWTTITVVDQPEQTVSTLVVQYTCSDGTVFDNAYDVQYYSAVNGVNYWDSSYYTYETIPAVTHTEQVDNGSYQQVYVGQRWVVDVPAHWE